jgi:hypothetical protein
MKSFPKLWTKRIRQYCGYYGRMVSKLVTVAALTAASTCVSYLRGLRVDLHGNDIVSLAVVFPLAFAVNAAYQRRQDALTRLASLKGHALALRLCFAHWDRSHRQHESLLAAVNVLLDTFFRDLKRYLSHKKLSPSCELDIVNTFTAMSLCVDKLRLGGLGSAELAMANSYLRTVFVDFERMKTAHMYRTPSSLLLYLKVFLVAIPIIYGPVFANIAKESGSLWYGVFLAVLFAVVLIALDNTQDVLENPYDGLSPDDIQFRHPTAILQARVARSWSDAVPHLPLPAEGRTELTERTNGGERLSERCRVRACSEGGLVHSPTHTPWVEA